MNDVQHVGMTLYERLPVNNVYLSGDKLELTVCILKVL